MSTVLKKNYNRFDNVNQVVNPVNVSRRSTYRPMVPNSGATVGSSSFNFSLHSALHKSSIYKFPQLVYNVDIDDYDNRYWITNNDYPSLQELNQMPVTDDDMLLRNTQITSICDQIPDIINPDEINAEDSDGAFKKYLDTVSDGIQVVTNTMLDRGNWQFSPIEKFTLIYLTLALKYEKRALKYLVKSPHYNKSILITQDHRRSCPITVLLSNFDPEICNYIPGDDILAAIVEYDEKNPEGISPIIYACVNKQNLENFMNSIDFASSLIFAIPEKYPHVTPFHYACLNDSTIAEYILGLEEMSKEYFNCKMGSNIVMQQQYHNMMNNNYNNNYNNNDEDDDDEPIPVVGHIPESETSYKQLTCLMLAAANDPELLFKLMDSPFCSKELVEFENNDHGNVLQILAKFHPNHVEEFITRYSSFITGNIISMSLLNSLINNPEVINKLLHCDGFDIRLLTPEFISSAFRTNTETFKVIINSDLLPKEYFKNNSGMFINALNDKPEEISHIINSKYFCTQLLKEINEINQNVIMLMAKGNILEKSIDIIKPLLTYEILAHEDTDTYNTFAYICRFAPRIAIELLTNENSFSKKLLTNTYREGSIILHLVFCICCDKQHVKLLECILNSKYINTEQLSLPNNEGNNLLLEVAKYRPINMNIILANEKLTVKQFHRVNLAGYNVLLLCLETLSKLKSTLSINSNVLAKRYIELITNHKYCTPSIIRQENICKENILMFITSLNNFRFVMNLRDFDKKYLLKKNDTGETFLMIICRNIMIQDKLEFVKEICQHELFNKETFIATDVKGKTCVDIMLQTSTNALNGVANFNINNIDILEYIINHDYCNSQLIINAVKNLLTYHGHTFNPKIVKYIMASKYCTPEVFLITNNNKINMLMTCMTKDTQTAKSIIESTYCTTELLGHTDLHGSNLLFYINKSNSEIIFKNIIDSSHFIEEILLSKNKNNLSALYHFILNGMINNIRYILTSDKFKFTEKLLTTSYDENTNFNLISSMALYDIDDIILDLPIVTAEMLVKNVDILGRSCLHNCPSDVILKKIIYSEKCSSELLELQDNDKNTFLHIEPKYINIVLDSPLCTTKLINTKNNKDIDIMTIILAQNNKSALEKILNSKVYELDMYQIPFVHLVNCSDELFEIFVTSGKCTNEVINKRDKYNMVLLTHIICFGAISKLSLLLAYDINLSESFSTKSDNGLNIFMEACARNDLALFEMLVESKFMKPEYIFEVTKYGHNVAVYAFKYSFEIAKYLINSKYWDELMYSKDIDNDYLLLHPTVCDFIKYLLENDKCSFGMLKMQNKMGFTCLHNYVLKNYHQALVITLNDKLCNDTLVQMQDIYGRTCLHIACTRKTGQLVSDACTRETGNNKKIALEIINSKYLTLDLLSLQDIKGRNVLMICVKHNPDLVPIIFDKLANSNTQELLLQRDKQGDSLLIHCIRYSLPTLEYILKNTNLTNIKYVIMLRNNKFLNAVLFACRYNPTAVELFAKYEYITSDVLYIHIDHGSAFTIAARYQPEAIKHLLNVKNISWQALQCLDNKTRYDFLQMGAVYQPLVIKYALDNPEYDFTELLNNNERMTPLMLATKYQPDAVNYILESRYGNSELIRQRFNNINCIDIAYNHQPKSLYNLILSKHGTDEILNEEDQYGYRLIHKLGRIYPYMSTLEDITENELIEVTNDVCDDDDPDICYICYEYSTKIKFDPCKHTCCVGCAFKLKDCHICKQEIDLRKVIRNDQKN